MVVAHNILAMNAQRMLGMTTDKQKKSTEKLSSGYRVNRAADDAAGLSISEKMRKQIRGLDRASTNASDGISAVQTAEGALNEVQAMLHRMNELAVQSANGTNSVSDRAAIQNEIDQLTTEVDRVAETTKFNETYLLKGDKNQTKKVSWKYNNNYESTKVTYGVMKDTTTGLAVSGKFTTGGSQDDVNFLLRSMRDSGFYVSQTKTYDATSGGFNTAYSLQLTGEAAQRYEVVTVNSYSTSDLKNTVGDSSEGIFSIQTKGGEEVMRFALSGGNAPDPSSTDQVHVSSAVVTSSFVTAAKFEGEQAQYYDKDGNKIPENALDRYFSLANGSIQQASGTATTVDNGGGSSASEGASGSGGSSGSAPASTGSVSISSQSVLNGKATSAITLSYDGSNWKNGGSTINLSDYGISVSGTPAEGDTISISKARKEGYGGISETGETMTVIATGQELVDLTSERIWKYESTSYGDVWQGAAGGTIGDSIMRGYFSYTTWPISDTTRPTSETITIVDIPKIDATVTYNRAGGSSDDSGGGSGDGSGSGSKTKVDGNGIVPKTTGGLVYDAVGNLTSLNPAYVNAKRDLWGDVPLTIHVGADATKNNKIQINIACMSSKSLGINGLRVDGSDDTNAMKAISTIAEALQKVSDQRAILGAGQNRLEHTINNLENVVENTEAAESRIRDTDMAEEMVTYSKNNILAQAGQSMLAQANQSNQGVVSLLG